MEQLVDKVVDTIIRAGLVEVEVSARHVHLTEQDMEVLFGKGAVLHERGRCLQKGQFLCEERVNLVGPRGRKRACGRAGT